MSVNKCGDCSMCCKLPALPEMAKAPNEWCRECKVGQGCGIYEARPQVCRDYQCFWLATQETPAPLPLQLRPDKCKVVIAETTNPRAFSAFVDPVHPRAHLRDDVQQLIGRIVLLGNKVVIVGDAGKREQVMYQRQGMVVGKTPIVMSEPDENGLMWFSA